MTKAIHRAAQIMCAGKLIPREPGTLRVLAFGAGTDSTGILAGWKERGLQETDPIHVIVFADTGGERKHTYEHLDIMDAWLVKNGFPPITRVRKGGRQETLEENCLRMDMLPSLAYGFKGCSHKYKIDPQNKFFNNLPEAREVWAAGQLVTKMIGYEAREVKRWKRAKRSDDKYEYEFPLVEWNWNREDCEAAIKRVGLPLPKKSSCFFCPASTLPEIRQLRDEYPVLFVRALDMEARFLRHIDYPCKTCKGSGKVDYSLRSMTDEEYWDALDAGQDLKVPGDVKVPGGIHECPDCAGMGRKPRTVKGLGRRFAWADLDVIDIDAIEVADMPRIEACRSCVDVAQEDDDEL